MSTVNQPSLRSRIISWLIDSFAAYGQAINWCPLEGEPQVPEENDPPIAHTEPWGKCDWQDKAKRQANSSTQF